MNTVLYLIIACGLLALVYSIWAARLVMSADAGSERMPELARAIQAGARAYLTRPYTTNALTGAGDIFAAAFLIHLWETEDVWKAARFAACAASFVVEGEGTTAIPNRDQIEARLRRHPEIVCR